MLELIEILLGLIEILLECIIFFIIAPLYVFFPLIINGLISMPLMTKKAKEKNQRMESYMILFLKSPLSYLKYG